MNVYDCSKSLENYCEPLENWVDICDLDKALERTIIFPLEPIKSGSPGYSRRSNFCVKLALYTAWQKKWIKVITWICVTGVYCSSVELHSVPNDEMSQLPAHEWSWYRQLILSSLMTRAYSQMTMPGFTGLTLQNRGSGAWDIISTHGLVTESTILSCNTRCKSYYIFWSLPQL